MARSGNRASVQDRDLGTVCAGVTSTLFRSIRTHSIFFGVIMRYLCVHGHFYQPPRENPSLEAIELQDSAYPYHDWNERVSSECYAPNAKSRILDGEQRIVELMNNYSRISFNFGPTLLSWVAEKAPKTYEALREADKSSRERFSGHGSAIAQAYKHM